MRQGRGGIVPADYGDGLSGKRRRAEGLFAASAFRIPHFDLRLVPQARASSTQLGFFRGASLKDPKRLLRGKGAYVRHIRITKRSGIDEKAFRALLRQAAK